MKKMIIFFFLISSGLMHVAAQQKAGSQKIAQACGAF